MLIRVGAIIMLAAGLGVVLADAGKAPLAEHPTTERPITERPITERQAAVQDISVKLAPPAAPPAVPARQRAEPRQQARERGRDRARELERELRQPKDYEIVYLGSEACPACRRWEADQYADWRRDPVRRKVPVRMAEVERFSINRGVRGENFGRYHWIYERAFKGQRFAFPAFVLMDGRDIVDAGTGASSWRRFVRVARDEVRYADWREGVIRAQREADRAAR
ncbi:MAG: hypothetical protein AAFY34_05880 [Pseudomonadota bacterium]